MFKFLVKIIPALQAGKELKNVVLWKNTQATTNRIYTVLAFTMVFIRVQWPEIIPVSDESLLKIAGGITICLAEANSFLTKATTKKIGTQINS